MAESLLGYISPTAKSADDRSRRFVPRFGLYAGAAIAVFYLAPSEYLLEPLLAALAMAVGALARAVGVDAIVSGSLVVVPGNFGIEIVVECSGVPELLLFLSAVLAYPASGKSRVAGAMIAIAGVMVGNIVRLAALFLIGVHALEYFDPVHAYVQGILSYILMVVLWLGWLHLSAPTSYTDHKPAKRQAFG
jgi:exosortase/archaeosortase family protein